MRNIPLSTLMHITAKAIQEIGKEAGEDISIVSLYQNQAKHLAFTSGLLRQIVEGEKDVKIDITEG